MNRRKIVLLVGIMMSVQNIGAMDREEKFQAYEQDIQCLIRAVEFHRANQWVLATQEVEKMQPSTWKTIVDGTSILAEKQFKHDKERRQFLARVRVKSPKHLPSPKAVDVD